MQHTSQSSPTLIEKATTVSLLFYMTGALLPKLLNTPAALAGTIRPVDLSIKLLLYSLGLYYIVRTWKDTVGGLLQTKSLLALLMLALLSTLWSEDPILTFRAGMVLTATYAFGAYFGTRYTIDQQLRLLGYMFSIVVMSCFMYALCAPTSGVEQNGAVVAWTGAFLYKNQMAQAMVLSVIVFRFARTARAGTRYLGGLFSVILLVLSGSATGTVVCSMLLCSLFLFRTKRFAVGIATAAAACAAIVTLLAILNETHGVTPLDLLNRSSDLTGRTELWTGVIRAIERKPLLGYGFSAFWRGMDGESGVVLETVEWEAGYAHNGFLDLFLSLGIVGLALFVLGFIGLFRRVAELAGRDASRTSAWLLCFLVFMLLYNITEGCILTQNSLYWALYISVAVAGVRIEAGYGRSSPQVSLTPVPEF